jgi:hypothetical protein
MDGSVCTQFTNRRNFSVEIEVRTRLPSEGRLTERKKGCSPGGCVRSPDLRCVHLDLCSYELGLFSLF